MHVCAFAGTTRTLSALSHLKRSVEAPPMLAELDHCSHSTKWRSHFNGFAFVRRGEPSSSPSRGWQYSSGLSPATPLSHDQGTRRCPRRQTAPFDSPFETAGKPWSKSVSAKTSTSVLVAGPSLIFFRDQLPSVRWVRSSCPAPARRGWKNSCYWLHNRSVPVCTGGSLLTLELASLRLLHSPQAVPTRSLPFQLVFDALSHA